jgi:hypothetical protein
MNKFKRIQILNKRPKGVVCFWSFEPDNANRCIVGELSREVLKVMFEELGGRRARRRNGSAMKIGRSKT